MTTIITVEANEAELALHAQATVRLSAADAYRIAERLLATTEDSLRALVKAADAEVSSRLADRTTLTLAEADQITAIERLTEKRLATWARQVLHMPLPGTEAHTEQTHVEELPAG